MRVLDRLLGAAADPAGPRTGPHDEPGAPRGRDGHRERSIEAYRALLRTAPAETIEQVHREAFSTLDEAQRVAIYEGLSRGAGTGERPLWSEPAPLARAAARRELRDPGSLERLLAVVGPDLDADPVLAAVADGVVGSALASAFLPRLERGRSALRGAAAP